MIKLYQSYNQENHLQWISNKVTPFDYTSINGCEYDIFKVLRNQNQHEKLHWGLFSWKFSLKAQIPIDDFINFANIEIKSGADCVFINPMIGNESIFATPWEQGYLCGHTGIEQIYKLLEINKIISHSEISLKNTFAFCNYFVANNTFWDNYFEFVDSALDFIAKSAENDPSLFSIYYGSANYAKNNALTMRPFIIERLFTSFISTNYNGFKIIRYDFDQSNYHNKFGFFLGNYLFELSELKSSDILSWHKIRSKMLLKQPMFTIMCMDDPSEDFIL